MSACSLCCPWNLPLERHATLVIGLESVGFVGMKFEEWIAYHMHVVIHQDGKYGGQIEDITAHLKATEAAEAARQTTIAQPQVTTNG